MSYPTAQRLQYGGTLAQESAFVRPHVPTSKHCNGSFPRHRNLTDCFILQRTKAASRRVDTDHRPHRMLLACRPEKAARFVFAKTGRAAFAPMHALWLVSNLQ